VGIFDSDEFDVFHFRFFPLEGARRTAKSSRPARIGTLLDVLETTFRKFLGKFW